MWEYTHTHTHTSSLVKNNKKNGFFVLELNQTQIINTLRNVKVFIRNKIYKKSRNIISCEYIDTGWYYLLIVMEKIKVGIK